MFGLRWTAPAKGVEAMGFGVRQRAIVDRLIHDDSQHDGGPLFDDRWDGRAIDEINRLNNALRRSLQMMDERASAAPAEPWVIIADHRAARNPPRRDGNPA